MNNLGSAIESAATRLSGISLRSISHTEPTEKVGRRTFPLASLIGWLSMVIDGKTTEDGTAHLACMGQRGRRGLGSIFKALEAQKGIEIGRGGGQGADSR